MLDRFLQFFRKQSAATRAIVGWLYNRGPVWTPIDYEQLSRESYQRNPHAYACITTIATACKGIPLLAQKKRRNLKRWDEIEHGPLVNLLKRPNPGQTGSSFVEQCISYYLLSGNAYVERVGPNAGPPKELYSQRPDRMLVVPGDRYKPVAGFEYRIGDPPPKWDTSEMWHWKAFHPTNDWYGMAPLEAAARAVDQNNAALAWNTALLQNSARMSGTLSFKEPLTDEQFRRIDEQIKQESGPQGAGRVFISDGGNSTFTEMTRSPVDMDWANGLMLSAEAICEVLSVPPEIVGVNRAKKFNSYPEARKALYEEGVLPRLDDFCEGLTAFLAPHFGDDIRIAYDKDQIEAIREDQDKVHMRVRDDVKGSIITPNEAREAIGYEASDSEGADDLYVHAQLIPMEAQSSFELPPPVDPNAPKPDEDAKKAALDAFDRISKADFLTDEQKQRLVGIQ